MTARLIKCGSADRYEEYLDKQITAADIFYLEDVSLARQLVELGYVQVVQVAIYNQGDMTHYCGPQIPWQRRSDQT